MYVFRRLLSHGASWRSVYLQGIDNTEIMETVHARRAPMIPSARRFDSERRSRERPLLAQRDTSGRS
jgi:hypothetical protein